MAKIFKFSGYVVAPDDDFNYDDLEDFLSSCPDAIVKHINIAERDVGEWDDDNPLNYLDCPVEECEKYFKEKCQTGVLHSF